jgi:hypothetical protein
MMAGSERRSWAASGSIAHLALRRIPNWMLPAGASDPGKRGKRANRKNAVDSRPARSIIHSARWPGFSFVGEVFMAMISIYSYKAR